MSLGSFLSWKNNLGEQALRYDNARLGIGLFFTGPWVQPALITFYQTPLEWLTANVRLRPSFLDTGSFRLPVTGRLSLRLRCRGPKFHWLLCHRSSKQGLKLLSFPSRTPSVLLLGSAPLHHPGNDAGTVTHPVPSRSAPLRLPSGHVQGHSGRVEASRNTRKSKKSCEMLWLILRAALRFFLVKTPETPADTPRRTPVLFGQNS